MRTQFYVATIGCTLLVVSTVMEAHHAFSAEFDSKAPVKLAGQVTKVEWTNPHIWIHIDARDPDGKVTDWKVEGGAPNAMFRRGWNKNSIQPGTQVTINGYRAKNGTNTANGQDVLLPDGKQLFLGSSGTGAPYDAGGSEKK